MRKPLHQYTELAGENNMNWGCASNLIDSPGNWVNVDLHNLEAEMQWHIASEPRDLAEAAYDLIVASHVLEHMWPDTLFYVLDNAWYLLKPGGHFLAITPHGASNDAWENPHHLSYFSEGTYDYFTPGVYEAVDTGGLGAQQGQPVHPWEIQIALVPDPVAYKTWSQEWGQAPRGTIYNGPTYTDWARTRRNVYREVHAILKKTEE